MLGLIKVSRELSLRAKCWLREGVGRQFPRNLNWSICFYLPACVVLGTYAPVDHYFS